MHERWIKMEIMWATDHRNKLRERVRVARKAYTGPMNEMCQEWGDFLERQANETNEFIEGLKSRCPAMEG